MFHLISVLSLNVIQCLSFIASLKLPPDGLFKSPLDNCKDAGEHAVRIIFNLNLNYLSNVRDNILY